MLAMHPENRPVPAVLETRRIARKFNDTIFQDGGIEWGLLIINDQTTPAVSRFYINRSKKNQRFWCSHSNEFTIGLMDKLFV